MIETTKYARKPFFVDAVQVTEENLEEVAKWCLGDIHTMDAKDGKGEQKYVKVRVNKPMTPRQTQAFAGDWILYAETGGYKVYTPNAFANAFELAADGASSAKISVGSSQA